MRHFYFITALLLSAVLLSSPAKAQPFDPEHRHSIEISTGVPPVQSLVLSTSSHSVQISRGFKDTRLFIPTFNLAYTYSMNEKWDLNVVINGSGAFYRRDQYPMKEVEYRDAEGNLLNRNNEPDYKAGILSSRTLYSGTMYTPMVDFRWKWMIRDNFRLYSSFGLSCVVLGNFGLFIPLPYLTPIGINFGKGHFYGLAEVNASSASTGLLTGAGYRF